MNRRMTAAAKLALAAIALVLVGCNKPEQPSGGGNKPSASSGEIPAKASGTALVSAEKTSFPEVTAHLDPGGSLYVYLSTEQLLAGVSDKISSWRQILNAVPNAAGEERENINKAFDVVTSLVKESGIEDVSGCGASSIAREPGLYHTKVLVHHYQGKGSGFLWTMFGQKPHALEGLNLLPDTTALTYFGDLDIPMLWSVVRKQVSKAGFPQAEQALASFPDAFEGATGLKWDQVLSSLGGEFGFALMLDEAHKIQVPLPGGSMEVPEPSLMLVAKVKDEIIFNRLHELMKQAGQDVVSVDKPNLKMRTLPLPLPLPIQLRPTIALSEGYLLIANSDAVVQQALAARAGQGKGLKTTAEFQRMSKDIPLQGNQFSFVSQRFGQTFLKVQQQAIAHAGSGSSDSGGEWLQSLLGTNAAGNSFGVSANTDEGWLMIANGNQHPAKLLLAAGVVPAAMLSAIAIPNFVKARQTAQQHACISNLRQIEGAKATWALENKKSDTDIPRKADLVTYCKNEQFPVCPSGGTYTINAVSKSPECSISGHAIEK